MFAGFYSFTSWKAEDFWSVVSEYLGESIHDLSGLSAAKRTLMYGRFWMSFYNVSLELPSPCLKLQFKCERRPLDFILHYHVRALVSDLKGILKACLPAIKWKSMLNWVPGVFPDEDQVLITNYFDARTASDPDNPESYHLYISKEHHDGNNFVVVVLYGQPIMKRPSRT